MANQSKKANKNMKKEKYIGKFVGPDEITNVVLVNSKTYMGKDRVRVSFKSSSDKEYPLEMLDHMITEKAIDYSDLRERRVYPVVDKILTILVESELTALGTGSEIEYACGPKLMQSLKEAAKRVQEKIMGKPQEEITLLDLDLVLRGGADKKPKKK